MPSYISSPNHSKCSPSNSTREHISWLSALHLALLCSLFLLPYHSSHDSVIANSRAICHTLQSRFQIPLLAPSLWTHYPHWCLPLVPLSLYAVAATSEHVFWNNHPLTLIFCFTNLEAALINLQNKIKTPATSLLKKCT